MSVAPVPSLQTTPVRDTTQKDLEAALTFIRSFPDCSSWNILLLDQERKNALVHRPQLSTQALLAELSVWMKLPCHFFIRPNLNSVVMIDLDNFTGSLSKLLQLHPRALVQTSRQSYQLWLTLDQRHQARDAQIVTQELTKALGGDPCSARITQVGRLPGSINRKPEKQCHTHLLYSGLANLDEAQYLQLTSNPQMRLQHGSVQTDSAPPKRDISRDDWREACHFFESNPQATLEDAIQHCPLLAKRGNQDYYARLTLNKAMNHVRAKGASASAGSRQPSASVEPPSGAQASGMAPAAPQYVTLSQVQQIVQDALQRQSASSSHSTKTCHQCKANKNRDLFSHTQWLQKDGVCLACRPVEERFRRRALSGKVCAACEIEKPRDQYSNTQWEKGTASKCIACCSTPQANNAKVWVRSCMAQLQARCAIFCREMPGLQTKHLQGPPAAKTAALASAWSSWRCCGLGFENHDAGVRRQVEPSARMRFHLWTGMELGFELQRRHTAGRSRHYDQVLHRR